MSPNSEDIPGEQSPVVLVPVDAPDAGGIRLRHMMYWVGVCAVVAWLTVLLGVWVLALSLVGLVAAGVGLVVIFLRRSSARRESLLWALAVAAERSMPLADAALAFSDQYGRSYRWRVRLLASLLNEGLTLPEALARVPDAVSREAEVLIRAGYSTGTLPRALREAASLRASRNHAWGLTAARFTYLAWVLAGAQAVSAFILYFIIPKFEAIFKDFGVSLPPVTIYAILFSHFVLRYFYIFFPIFFLLEVAIPVALLAGLLNSYALWWDVPLLDRLFRRRHSAVILRSLALAVEGNRSISSALEAVSVAYPSVWVRRRLERVDEDVKLGRDWVESLLDRSLIRPAEAAVLRSAQRVGNLVWALREAAEAGDRRLGYRLDFWIQMLFPFLILALGCVVFLFAVAYFTPLVRLIEALAG